MVFIKSVNAKKIFDSRKEKTILITIKTNVGVFSASSPNGKSKGKYEALPYKKDLDYDIFTIKKFKDYFSDESIDCFDDLRRIEDIVDGHLGANTIFALESATLKALAKEKKEEIWQLINENYKNKNLKFPRLVGNCIGGGKHSKGKKPDFQEFLLIPKENSIFESQKQNKKIKSLLYDNLKKIDRNFSGKKNDENAWMTSLNDKSVLDILKEIVNNFKIDLGIDCAASTFYKRKKYHYLNPSINRDKEEQFNYISNLLRNYPIFYIEDPFDENDFVSFSRLLKKYPNRLIVGDDLTVTNLNRLKKALEMKSINAIIIKPNQNGFLSKVKEVCDLAKKNNIKIIFSHRSGETEETILADLAFGFQADFLKSGISGKEREVKIKRLIEIEKKLKR
ncbi:MAG: enolase [Candidatus Pacearchaeota archaeon]|nr:MAG: enolase [Candidatus Pacearchaeota archaeon]